MKTTFEAFKKWQFRMIILFLRRIYGKMLDEHLNKMVLSLASDVSQKLYMDTLKREGFLHCEKCAQRFGLKRGMSGKLYCQKHYEPAPLLATV